MQRPVSKSNPNAEHILLCFWSALNQTQGYTRTRQLFYHRAAAQPENQVFHVSFQKLNHRYNNHYLEQHVKSLQMYYVLTTVPPQSKGIQRQ